MENAPANLDTSAFPPLLLKCPDCQGRGSRYAGDRYLSTCESCDGEGVLSTAFGRQVLRLVDLDRNSRRDEN